MIKFFRKIRHNLLSEGKTGKYLKYAIGEIVLVVIGILIALQINNLNERFKQKQQLRNYEKNITSELAQDLIMLNSLDSLFNVKIEEIHNHITYFNRPEREIDSVIQKMYGISYNGLVYRSISYTIDEIINTGNLSLFSSEKKTAILELKAIQEFYEKNRIEVEQKWVLSNLEFENAIDLVAFNEQTSEQSKKNQDWRFNLDSEQYRLFNNKALAEMRLYYFRKDQNNQMRIHSENLLKLIEKK